MRLVTIWALGMSSCGSWGYEAHREVAHSGADGRDDLSGGRPDGSDMDLLEVGDILRVNERRPATDSPLAFRQPVLSSALLCSA